MKKLYANIEDIFIKGNPTELSRIITEMDNSLQNISEGTEQLTSLLIKYSNENSGKQFEKVVKTLLGIRDVLYQSSIDLNDMQKQVVAYQNKVFRYEDSVETAAVPNQYLVVRTDINVDTSSVHFNRMDMIDVKASLVNYRDAIIFHTRNINESKNSIALIWQDSQYIDFAEFIEEVCNKIIDALKIFDDYILYLDEKIRELS